MRSGLRAFQNSVLPEVLEISIVVLRESFFMYIVYVYVYVYIQPEKLYVIIQGDPYLVLEKSHPRRRLHDQW